MDVWILESAQAVAVKAGDICAELIRRKPDARLGLATGPAKAAADLRLTDYYQLVDEARSRLAALYR